MKQSALTVINNRHSGTSHGVTSTNLQLKRPLARNDLFGPYTRPNFQPPPSLAIEATAGFGADTELAVAAVAPKPITAAVDTKVLAKVMATIFLNLVIFFPFLINLADDEWLTFFLFIALGLN